MGVPYKQVPYKRVPYKRVPYKRTLLHIVSYFEHRNRQTMFHIFLSENQND